MTIKHVQAILAIDEVYLSQTLGAQDGVNNIQFSDFFTGADGHLVFRRRHELETNETYLQVLPYALVAREPKEGEEPKFLCYYRPKSGGEARLHGNLSFGFGGHIDMRDARIEESGKLDFLNTVIGAMRRELEEELGIDETVFKMARIAGYQLITDKSNAVGRVHLGVVFFVVIDADTPINPDALEIDYAGEFTTEELRAKHDAGEIQMENWTKLLTDKMIADTSQPS